MSSTHDTRGVQRKRKRRSASARKRHSTIDVVPIDSRLKQTNSRHHKHKRHSQHHRPSLPTPSSSRGPSSSSRTPHPSTTTPPQPRPKRHSHVHHHHHHHIHSHHNADANAPANTPTESPPRRPSTKLRGIPGLKLNLAAAPIATQSHSGHRSSGSKSTRKARSKPAPDTMDLTRRSARPFDNIHGKNRKPKHRGSNTPQSHSHSARFRKRISAPIVVPSSISGNGANFDGIDHASTAPQTPHTPMTPYYHNLRRQTKHHPAIHAHSHVHNHGHAHSPQTVPAQSAAHYTYDVAMSATKKRGSVDLEVSSDDSHLEHEHEHEQYLDEQEINDMIRSFRRISKSRPRAYSKSRRVSQKLFGLMESMSFSKELSNMERPSPPPPTLSPSPSSPEEFPLSAPNEPNETETETSLEASETSVPTEPVEDVNDVAEGCAGVRAEAMVSTYHSTLLRYGYAEVKVIAKSLQGVVVEARRTEEHADFETDAETVIIKITSKQLHSAKLSNKHGKALAVQEDIIKEKKLLMYLTANQPPDSLVKFLGFFSDCEHYFLVMENGGCDFFDWIVKCHAWIRAGKLSLKQWKLYIADLMQQIVEFVRWMHVKMKVVHLDISLENMLIKHNKFKSDGNGGIRLSRKMQVKICDFGLAEYFCNGNESGFACSKYVGKTHYKAPKVYGKRDVFDARKADVWSLGVSFFMMMVGAPPYKLPLESDDHFPMIAKNDVMAILRRWGRENYIDETAEHLLNRMLCVEESERIDTETLCAHRFFARNRRSSSKTKGGAKGKRRSMNWKKRMSLPSSSAHPQPQPQPQPPVNSPVNAVPLRVLMESANHNIFQHLVMSDEDGQLFRYRKRKLTST